jgi:hypothetical protein
MVHRGSPVKSMREFPDRELKWTQPKRLKRYFELLCGDDRIGTLRWEKSFGSLATAEASEGQWTFKRGGFGGLRVTVRESGSAETIAMFELSLALDSTCGTGSLQYRGGQRIRWAPSGSFWHWYWHPRCMWVSVNGLEIAGFCYHRGMKTEGRLEVSTHGAGLPELPLLALLGWYLLTPRYWLFE